MRTTAVRDGDDYVINGVKRFITGADKADFMILMAATDREKGSRGGISCFLVDMDTPGVRLGERYDTLTGEQPWEIVLDNVRVPIDIASVRKAAVLPWGRNGSGRAAETGSASAWARPGAVSNSPRLTRSSASPSAVRSPTARASNGG